MQQNEQLTNIIEQICQKRLGSGLVDLENYLLSHPNQSEMDKLIAIKDDYRLMADYWQRGFGDPERQQLYDKLLRRLFVLTSNILIHENFRSSYFWMDIYHRPRHTRKEWTMDVVRAEMESYVADTALLELEPANKRDEKSRELNVRHQQLMHDLFDYILTSRLWNESLADAFVSILLAPTIDSRDQQLIVSAITLSLVNTFGINKLKVLMNVYQNSADLQVRERAFVGWVLALDAGKARLYPEIQEMVQQICQDENSLSELTELQMQLFYCMDAEDDQRKIRDEIMPDIMNGSRMKITKRGLVEMDEDTLEDILHPDAAERDMEKMEKSVQRMAEMQKQGSDIYFAGFSQMKRFSFFNDLSNWFVPFYANHPAIHDIWKTTKGSKFLHTITQVGAFCDSDKYSFVLAFEQVRSHLPAQMLKMVEEGEASPMPIGGDVAEEERNTPAFIRRMYLQNMYRFFRLYQMREEFKNPFAQQSTYLFFANRLFEGTSLEKRMPEVAAFLLKRRRYAEAQMVLDCCGQDVRDYQYYMMMGSLLQHLPLSSWISEAECYRKALDLQPDSLKAKSGLARALFRIGNYEGALKAYEQLLEEQPDTKSYMLNAAICLSNLNRYEEALKILFKLNYLYPQDEYVNRVLAWVLTLAGKYEQAQKVYEQLLALDQPAPDDILNCGFCFWFSGNVANAVQFFRQYMSSRDTGFSKMETIILQSEYDIIRQHGISDVEIHLMLDILQV